MGGPVRAGTIAENRTQRRQNASGMKGPLLHEPWSPVLGNVWNTGLNYNNGLRQNWNS
jgi:hypothetical protein